MLWETYGTTYKSFKYKLLSLILNFLFPLKGHSALYKESLKGVSYCLNMKSEPCPFVCIPTAYTAQCNNTIVSEL